MADRKLELNISADASQLKNDLANLLAQLKQLSNTAESFNSSLVSGFSKTVIEQEKLNQAIVKTQITQERLNQEAGKTLIAEERLSQAAISRAATQQKSADQQVVSQQKVAQAIAQTQTSQEKLAQTAQKSATQQQTDAAKVAIANENILKATAQREAAEARVANATRQSSQQQEASSKSLLGGIQGIAFGFNNLVFSVQNFAGIANSTFQSLVGSSIQLEQQLISIRGALAATNDIQVGGKSLADPLEKINKLAPSVNKAIAQVRRDSLELANITSDDLLNSFSVIAGEIGNIGASLDDAAKLTKAFGGSFSALGIPLAGARQEITSILQGTIDQNSALAKSLAITNTQIQQEKAKGTLVDFLLKKTEALTSAQSLIAKTFGGVTSNITELFQRLQESFGKAVLPPVVEQLTKVYDSLTAAQPQIEAFVSNLSSGLVAISTQVGTVLAQFIPTIQGLFTAIGTIAQTSVPLLGVALNGVLLALSAIAAILNVTIVPLLQGLNTGAGRFVVTVGLLALAVNGATTAFTLLAFRMGFVGPIASGLIGSIRAFISILQVQFAASVSSAGSALAALRAALLSVNAAFVALAAVAAIGAVVAFTVAVDASKKTVDAWKNSVDNTGSTIGRFTKRLKELQDQQKAGTITEEGRKQLEGYKKLLAETATDIPRQIKDLQDAVDNNKSFAVFKLNEDEAKEEIKRLKQFQQDIVNNLDETTIAGQKAANQGTLKEQFNTVSNNYYDEFKKGTNLAVTQAKTFVGVLQEEIELGARSKEEGLKRLKEISEGEFLLKEDRVAAAKAATAIIDKENKAQADSNNTKQAAIQAQIEAGSLSEIDGIKKTSALKEEAKNLEIKGIDEKLKFAIAGSDIERDLINQRKKAVAELSKIQTEEIQKQVAALRGGLERELSANADLRKKAELATQADILALKLGGFENENQLQEQSLLIKKQTIESELADKRRVLEFDKTALTNSNLSQKEREELILRIGNQEADIAKLNLDATDNLIARNKLLYDQKINNLEIEKTSTDRVSKLLESQNSLLSAQVKLRGAIADAQLKGAENQLTALKEADGLLKSNREKSLAREQKQRDANRAAILQGLDEEAKKKQEAIFADEDAAAEQKKAAKEGAIDREKERLSRERLAQLGVSAGQSELSIARQIFDQEQKVLELKARKFEQEQANAKRELEISIQQSQIRDKQLQVEAKIALIKAKASGSNEAIASALELVALTDEQVKNNQQIAGLQRQTLEVTQQSERQTFNQEQESAAFKTKITGAEAGLVGLQTSGSIKAGVLKTPDIPKEAEARQKLAEAKTPEKVKAIQDERKQDLAAVADGAVAFENTSQQVKDNFAALPDSLKATKAGLQEVIAQAKELSENPIFKSREEQAAKQKQAEAIAQTQQKTQPQALTTPQLNDPAIAKGANAAITAKNAQITKQNEVFGVVDRAIANNSDTSRQGQIENLKSNDPIKQADDVYVRILDNPNGEESKAYYARLDKKLRSDKLNLSANKLNKLARFTGGLTPANVDTTVNERGQEAVTNLQTLETSLLPNGERTVQFEAPTWVHNAAETKQLGSLGVFDSGNLPNINFGAINAVLRINNAELLAEMKLQNSLLSQLADGIKKPNVVNNFSNDPRPDLTAYRVATQLLRV